MMKKLFFTSVMLGASALVAAGFSLSGSVISSNQKMMTSRYMGFVKKMVVSEGDIVKQGDLLYVIDSKEIDAARRQVELAISQARLALQMNQNQLSTVLRNLNRHKRLHAKRMVSDYELENLELMANNLQDMVTIAKKQVAQAEAKMQEVMNQYRYLNITAPNDGVIVAKRVNEGEMAMPGMPALILTDLSNLEIVAEVSESQLQQIELGKGVKVEIPSLKFATTGKVASIIPSSNPMTHKFKIKVRFQKDNRLIYPGMYAKLYID